MWQDPIVEEVRRVRAAHAAEHDYDLQAIYAAVKAAEQASEREKIRFEPKRITPQQLAIKVALQA
jgi:hypothetical protein